MVTPLKGCLIETRLYIRVYSLYIGNICMENPELDGIF